MTGRKYDNVRHNIQSLFSRPAFQGTSLSNEEGCWKINTPQTRHECYLGHFLRLHVQ